MYIQVAVNIPHVSGVFDYHLPPELDAAVAPGCLVVVPFGKQTVQGIVVRKQAESLIQETRQVEGLLDLRPVLTPTLMSLASWISDQSLAPLGACLDMMLPPGLSQHADTLYRLNREPATQDDRGTSPLQQRLVELLEKRGELRARQIETALPHQNWKPAIQGLVRRGLVLSMPVLLPPSVRPKFIRTVQLTCPPDSLKVDLPDLGIPGLGRGAAGERRAAALRFLMQEPWPVAVSWAYASSGCTPQDLQKLAEIDLVQLGETEIWRDPLEEIDIQPYHPPVLTSAQQEALGCIRPALASGQAEPPLPFLLYGVTGSGKTEVYLHTVEETLRLGRQAVILVPEIALTPQTLRRFAGRFPGQVGLVHSRLSEGERYDTWRRARDGNLRVIVGPRSALFTPLPDLGLIVVDECHDDSYYQGDALCSFHAVNAAMAYARIVKCAVILGSATPPVDLMYQAVQQHWNVIRLPERVYSLTSDGSPQSQAGSLPLPEVEIVDMRQELKAGNRSIFSRKLQQAIGEVLNSNQQAILYLNRRGSATFVFCRECGHTLRCPRCSLPLTYHLEPGREAGAGLLICHMCHYKRQMPHKCPQCGSAHIRQYGAGTEKVEEEVQKLYPQARTLRWDAETTRLKGAHEILLSHFTRHQADILIGTQMLAKGLDLPLVTLVGAVLADVGLNFPDFRAGERGFHLLTQVAGRSGRSQLGGKAIFQTFQPESPAILAAAHHDYDGFYQREVEQRRRLGYPPFSHLVRVELRDPYEEKVEAAARAKARQIQRWIEEGGYQATEIIGPVPCFFGRVNSQYRWHFILRGPNPLEILRGKNLEDCRVELDPPSLL
jgi:primosomal protein N' (replication factor Y) (superfamily II helicase)